MKNLIRLSVLILMFFEIKTSLGQRVEDIFKVSSDSISPIKIHTYEVSMSQYNKDSHS